MLKEQDAHQFGSEGGGVGVSYQGSLSCKEST